MFRIKNIMPGEYYASDAGEGISTILGSCISVCLYDEVAGLGGMNHFLLPSGMNEQYASTRYGISAMEKLILNMQLLGGDRDKLKAKVFGGGNVLPLKITTKSVGERNIDFIRGYLKTEKIPVISEDVGGVFSRKVLFNTGDFSVKLSKTKVDNSLVNNEEEYLEHINHLKDDTQIIYF